MVTTKASEVLFVINPRRHHVKLTMLNINLNRTGKIDKKEHEMFSELILLHVTE